METIHIVGLLGVILLAFVRYLLFRINRKKFEELIDQFPGPRAYPIIGNTHMFIGSPTDVLLRGRKLLEYDGPIRLWLLHEPIILIFDPENLQIVANNSLGKGMGYGYLKDLLGEGLITAGVERWKPNRRCLNPAFNPRILHKQFFKVFNNEYKNLLDIFHEKAALKEEFDLWPLIIQSTVSTISLNTMDYRDDHDQKMKDIAHFGEMLLRASLIVSKRIYKPWLQPQIFYNIYKYLSGDYKIFREVHNFPKKIIKRKKKEYEIEKEWKISAKMDVLTGVTEKTFLDIVMKSAESKSHFTDDQLADELVTLLIAGSETTAVTVCSTLLMLAMHQHYQDKVYDELRHVFGDSPEVADLHQLNQLQFLDQCINETLRLFASVPFIFRNIENDVTLKDGKILPAGTTVCLAIIMLHLNPRIYDNPEIWNPNNFAPEAIMNRHKCAFVPFSEGPRSCIGSKYAMLSIKAVLTRILRKYKLSTSMRRRNFRPSFDIALRNLSGYFVSVEPR